MNSLMKFIGDEKMLNVQEKEMGNKSMDISIWINEINENSHGN